MPINSSWRTKASHETSYWLASQIVEMKMWRTSEGEVRDVLGKDIAKHGESSRFVALPDDEFALRSWTRLIDQAHPGGSGFGRGRPVRGDVRFPQEDHGVAAAVLIGRREVEGRGRWDRSFARRGRPPRPGDTAFNLKEPVGGGLRGGKKIGGGIVRLSAGRIAFRRVSRIMP